MQHETNQDVARQHGAGGGSTATVAGTLPREASEEARVLAEIERLMAELQERRNGLRPAPQSLVRAYQAAIEREYQRLDALAATRTRGASPAIAREGAVAALREQA